MLSYFQAVVLGLLQGVSELFPISSLGHSVIFAGALGWTNVKTVAPEDQGSSFLTFLVATHLATAVVLLLFFGKDWLRILKAMGRSLVNREVRSDDVAARTGWLVMVGTIPAGLIGGLFEHPLRKLFTSAEVAAWFLIANGVLLYGAEILRRRVAAWVPGTDPDEEISKLSWWKSIGIGAVQAIALIPGFSRSGAAMAGGLLFGLNNEDSARFAFLLATPIIGAAGLLKLPDLFARENHAMLGPCAVGAACSALTAYLAVRFLMKYFETRRLTAFAVYCLAAGIVSSLILMRR